MNRHIASLSPREIQMLALLSEGLTNAEIARALEPPVSTNAVKTYVGAVLLKLGVRSRVEAAVVYTNP
jgi:DNA-binding NarL/FixJ family response regulator